MPSDRKHQKFKECNESSLQSVNKSLITGENNFKVTENSHSQKRVFTTGNDDVKTRETANMHYKALKLLSKPLQHVNTENVQYNGKAMLIYTEVSVMVNCANKTKTRTLLPLQMHIVQNLPSIYNHHEAIF